MGPTKQGVSPEDRPSDNAASHARFTIAEDSWAAASARLATPADLAFGPSELMGTTAATGLPRRVSTHVSFRGRRP